MKNLWGIQFQSKSYTKFNSCCSESVTAIAEEKKKKKTEMIASVQENKSKHTRG